MAIAELLCDFGEGAVFYADRSKGFVLPVQNLRGAEKEVLEGEIVHGVASRIVTYFPRRRSSGALSSAQLQDRVCKGWVVGNAAKARPGRG